MSIEQPPFAPHSDDFESGLSTKQIMLFVRRYAVSIAAFVLLGIVVGVCITLTLPREWQARTVLQVGQVTRGNTVVPVETPAQTVERLNLPQFQDAVLRQLGLPLARSENPNTALLRDHVSIGLIRGTDLVAVSTRGYSADDARRFVEAYQARLIDEHKTLLDPSMIRSSAQIDAAKAALAVLQQQGAQLQSAAAQANGKARPDFSSDVLAGILLQSNSKEVDSLEQRLKELQEDADPLHTFNTRPLMAMIDVSDRPVFPRKSVFAELGALIGLVLGLIIAALRDRRAGDAALLGRR